jgi:hypothetical protein
MSRCHLASQDASNLSKPESQTRQHFIDILYSIWSHRQSIANDAQPRNVLVQLPSESYSNDLARNQSWKATSPDGTVFNTFVTIKHALVSPLERSSTVRFPTPIHEVCKGLDYLTSSLSPFNEWSEEAPRIALAGSHIGGALALMLALTEPNAVHSVAAIEPMVDWVGLDEIVEQLQALERVDEVAQRKQAKAMTSRYGTDTSTVLAATQNLVALRSCLFSTPSAYFDPFASPLLFLRAPGRDTPISKSAAQSIEYSNVESFGPYDDDWHISDAVPPSIPPSPQSNGLEGSASEVMLRTVLSPPRRRKVSRRWPAVGLPESFRLPLVKVFVQNARQALAGDEPYSKSEIENGRAALMRVQGSEMVELMRRACFIGRERSFAESRVHIVHIADTVGDEHASMQHEAFEWLESVHSQNEDTTKSDSA